MRGLTGIIWFFLGVSVAGAQPLSINRKAFFESDTATTTLYLTAYFKGISAKKSLEEKRPAHARLEISGSSSLSGDIELRARGDFRFENCYPPPIMLHFKTPTAGSLSTLGKLKLVWPCQDGEYYEQLLLKEYLAYRIFNILTPYSYRVRRIKVHYSDSTQPKKWTITTGFLLEDIDELAKRVQYKEREEIKTHPIEINPSAYAMLALFQYMIGNTDWGISAYHNIKLILRKDSLKPMPIAIPYDFDHSGLVNAKYAYPNEILPIEHVKQRLYMGVTMDSAAIRKALDIIEEKKLEIFNLIDQCEGFTPKVKGDVHKYISDFFEVIANRTKAMAIFMKPPELIN